MNKLVPVAGFCGRCINLEFTITIRQEKIGIRTKQQRPRSERRETSVTGGLIEGDIHICKTEWKDRTSKVEV